LQLHGNPVEVANRSATQLNDTEGPLRAYNAAMEHPQLVVVKAFGNRIDAELAKGALENAGIEATIQSDTVGRMREHIASTGAGFQILVREQDLAASREALTPIEDPEFEDDDSDSSGRQLT
jgi:F420-dependent methylenetetrahydromethanopterin dehydrogenase